MTIIEKINKQYEYYFNRLKSDKNLNELRNFIKSKDPDGKYDLTCDSLTHYGSLHLDFQKEYYRDENFDKIYIDIIKTLKEIEKKAKKLGFKTKLTDRSKHNPKLTNCGYLIIKDVSLNIDDMKD